MQKVLVLGTIFLVLAAATAARAATIIVTQRRDVVADDGRCSLREAVTAANTGSPSGQRLGECIGGDPAPAVDVIQLKRGSYKLTLGAPGDDLNAGGDLDVTDPVVIQGQGRGRTKIRNRIGDPEVPGDGDRLFHVDPAAVGGIDASFADLTLAGGDVGCTGAGCSAGASAVETTGNGALTFERCRVMKNRSFCSGDGCGDLDGGAAIRAFGGGALTIRRAKILKNRAECEGDGCRSGRAAIYMDRDDAAATESFVLEDSSITRNLSLCDGANCRNSGIASISARDIAVREVALAQNQVGCGGGGCIANNMAELFGGGTTTLEDVAVSDDTIGCEGDACLARSLLDLEGQEGLTLQKVDMAGNVSFCTGDSCRLLEHVGLTAFQGDAVLEDFVLNAGDGSCRGEECRIEESLDVFAGEAITLRRARIVDQELLCEGRRCTTQDVVALRAGSVSLEHSEVTGNALACIGETCSAGMILDVDAEGELALSDTDVIANANTCLGDGCQTFDVVQARSSDGLLTIAGGASNENDAGCEGDSCKVGSILDLEAELTILLDGTAIASNELHCAGDACRIDDLVKARADGVSFERTSVIGNASSCEGASCLGHPVVALIAGAATVDSSAFFANSSQCDGALCSVGLGGALHNLSGILVASGSTFADNRTDGFGAGIFNGARSELELLGVTMLRNEAGLRGTIEFGGFGGAIYNDADGGDRGSLLLRNTEIRDNQAALGGGGILNEGQIDSVQGSTLTGNQPTNCANFGGGSGCP